MALPVDREVEWRKAHFILPRDRPARAGPGLTAPSIGIRRVRSPRSRIPSSKTSTSQLRNDRMGTGNAVARKSAVDPEAYNAQAEVTSSATWTDRIGDSLGCRRLESLLLILTLRSPLRSAIATRSCNSVANRR